MKKKITSLRVSLKDTIKEKYINLKKLDSEMLNMGIRRIAMYLPHLAQDKHSDAMNLLLDIGIESAKRDYGSQMIFDYGLNFLIKECPEIAKEENIDSFKVMLQAILKGVESDVPPGVLLKNAIRPLLSSSPQYANEEHIKEFKAVMESLSDLLVSNAKNFFVCYQLLNEGISQMFSYNPNILQPENHEVLIELFTRASKTAQNRINPFNFIKRGINVLLEQNRFLAKKENISDLKKLLDKADILIDNHIDPGLLFKYGINPKLFFTNISHTEIDNIDPILKEADKFIRLALLTNKKIGMQLIQEEIWEEASELTKFFKAQMNNGEAYEKLLTESLIDGSTIKEAIGNDPIGTIMALTIFLNEKADNNLFGVVSFLEKTTVGREQLQASFAADPYLFVQMLLNLATNDNKEQLLPFINDNGTIDINLILSKSNQKLYINVFEIAAVNAAKGLISSLSIHKDNIALSYSAEITQQMATEKFEGYTDIRPLLKVNNDVQKIMFSGSFHNNLNEEVLEFSLVPLKYYLPPKISAKQQSKLREEMNLGSRKVIVVSSPDSSELHETLHAYSKFSPQERPILILGMRYPDDSLLRKLTDLGYKVNVRSDVNEELSLIGENNVTVLNTMGELLNFYSIADLAYIGEDRNLIEPASQGVPIIRFMGPGANNRDAIETMYKSGGAVEKADNLYDQSVDIMSNPQEMIRGVDEGIEHIKNRIHAMALSYSLVIASHNLPDNK